MKNKKYKYILFDWDGTLVKTLDVWIEAYKDVAKDLKIDLSNLTDNEVVSIFFGKQGEGYKQFGFHEVDSIYEKIKAIVDIKVQSVESYENAKETLEELNKTGIKIALHTTSNKNLLYPAIVNLDFKKFFEMILTKDDVTNPKPDPEVINKEIGFLNADKNDCLIVGDSESDLRVGKNAGVDTALFYPESHKKFYKEEVLMKENPTYVIRNLLDLVKIVN